MPEVFAFCPRCDKKKFEVAKKIAEDFDYEVYDLMNKWKWILDKVTEKKDENGKSAQPKGKEKV